MKKRILLAVLSLFCFELVGLGALWAAPAFDYDVTHITQSPKYFKYSLYEIFDNAGYWSYGSGIPIQAQGTENQKRWPQPGEPITFAAHVRNKGTSPAPPFNYRWSVNGAVKAEGTYPAAIPPQGESKIEFVFPWPTVDPSDHSKDTITFEVLTQDELPQNNQLTDYLAALSLSIWADAGQYQAFNARENAVGTYSFEDWIQWQVRTMNERFAASTYEGVAPQGILERVRIDKVVVADHVGPIMGQDPDSKVIDGRWQFTGNSQPDYDNYANNHAKKIDWGLIHELAHQLGVIDLYRIGLSPIDNFIRDDDGNPLNIGATPFRNPGIMAGGEISPHKDGAYFSSHDAGGLNRNLGYRRGYYGEYLYDIPKLNSIKVLDNQGQLVPEAKVTVYQKTTGRGIYLTQALLNGARVAKVNDAAIFHPGMQVNIANNTHNEGNNGDFITTVVSVDTTKSPPEVTLADGARYDYSMPVVMRRLDILPGKAKFSGTTDSNGLYLIPNDPPYRTITTATGHTLGPNPFGTINVVGINSTLFFKVQARGQTDYFDLDITDFNLAYYSGNREAATYPFPSHIPPAGAPEPPSGLKMRLEREKVALTWQPPSSGTVRYNVYRAAYPNYPFEKITQSPVDGTGFADTVDVGANLRYAVTAVDAGGLESRFSNRVFKPLIVAPNKIAINGEGDRFITDLHPHEGWMIKQDREGQYANYLIRRFLRTNAAAIDSQNRVVVASSGPFRILIYDPVSGQLINQFGSDGTQPGQLKDPQGVATDESYIYVADTGNHRIQVFASDSSLIASYGGMGSGTDQFLNPQGIAVEPTGRILVADSGNNRIQILTFDKSSNTIRYGQSLTYDFSEPRDVALDANGNIYVCDTRKNRVVKFDPNGGMIQEFKSLAEGQPLALAGPQGIAIDKETNLLVVVDTGNRRIATIAQAPPSPVTITATAGAGGTVQPSGAVAVNPGANQSFTIASNAEYRILDVKVDGLSKGAINTITIPNVTANHAVEATFAPEQSAPRVVFAVNCGGGQWTDRNGVLFQADGKYSGGSTFTAAVPINGTDDDPLYQSERWGNFSYNIPVPPGLYNVTLKFAETYYTITKPGQRVFYVRMEGQEVLSRFDILALAGKNTALDKTIQVNVTDGVLNIEFRSLVNNAKVNAILVTTAAPLSQYTIKAAAGDGGSISPTGSVNVPAGGTQTFMVIPNAGFRIREVKVNGESKGATNTITLANVTANQTVDATFASIGGPGPQVIFAVNCGGKQYTDKSGVVYLADTKFSAGNTYQTTASISGTSDAPLYQDDRWGTFAYNIPVTPGNYNVTLKFAEIYFMINKPGQRVFNVKIEGQEVLSRFDILAQAGKNTTLDKTFPVYVADATLTIEFISVVNSAKVNAILVTPASPAPVPYTITASAGEGGAISPPGAVSVESGGTQTFAITPNMGYRILDVKVDGQSKGAPNTLTLGNVMADHRVEAAFTTVPFVITATAGAGGTIGPSGTWNVSPGRPQSFTITPNAGYRIADVKVDGVSQGAIPSYTFQNIAANHTIEATFALQESRIDFYGNQVSFIKLFGQSAFGETSERTVVGNRVFHASGVVVDRSSRPNKIYVPDTGNSRILGFNGLGVCQNNSSQRCTNDMDCPGSTCQINPDKEADIVFGQPDLRSAACNRDSNLGLYGPASADSLCLTGFPMTTNTGEYWMKTSFDVDSQGNLYIVDVWNNRVLKYNQPFSADQSNGKGDTVADFVFGQPDFSSNQTNHGLGLNARDDHSLATGVGGEAANRGVSVDPQGNVWVADTFNGRVLRFPANSPNANLVLGQVNFTARDWSICEPYDWHPWDAPLNKLCRPTVARIHPDTGELLVIDEFFGGFSGRILVFKPPFANGMTAERVIPVKQDGMIENYGGGTEVVRDNINFQNTLSILKGDPNNLKYETFSAKLSAEELAALKQVPNADQLTDPQRNAVVRVLNEQRSPETTTLWDNGDVQFVNDQLKIDGRAIPVEYPSEGNLFFRKLNRDGVIQVDPQTQRLRLREGVLTSLEKKNLEWFLNGLLTDILGREVFSKRHYWWQFTGLDINYYKQGEYAQGLIWVSDLNVRRLILLDRNGNILKVIGPPHQYVRGCEGGFLEHKCGETWGKNFNLCWVGGSVGMDNANNLYLPDEGFMRIDRFALPYNTRTVGGEICPPLANGGLFNTTSANAVSGYKFGGSVGTFTYGNQLIVKDTARYMVWENYLQKEIGARADFVIGQPADDSQAGLPWNTLGTRGTHAIDDKGRMWTFNGHGKIIVFPMPFARGAGPLKDFVKLYWIDDRTEVEYGGGEVGLGFDPIQKKLWVLDRSHHRLLRVSNYDNFQNQLYVDMVIGQGEKSGFECNRKQDRPSANTLCAMSQIEFDKFGNLYVVENGYECHANDRITVYMADDLRKATGLFPNLSAKKVFIANNFNEHGGCKVHTFLTEPFSPVSLAFNSKNQMVVGNDGYYANGEERAWKQLWFYRDPLKKNPDGTFVQGQKPDAYIKIPLGAAAEINFDDQDNLVVQDHTWCKVWVINLDKDPSWLIPVNQ